MSASVEFKKAFTHKNLVELYHSSIRFNSAVGINKVNTKVFENSFIKNLEVIERKVPNGTYSFSQYREKLFSKGAGKFPRIISIPTIRDKITLKALYQVLSVVYMNETPFLHRIISDVNEVMSIGHFDSLIRLDIENFYPTIHHDILISEIKKKIRKKEIIKLINDAISQQTVNSGSGKLKSYNTIGIPQGLPISNILANIYMRQIDQKYNACSSIRYYRFVDDILIFCHANSLIEIKDQIIEDLKKIKLTIHTDNNSEKFFVGQISHGFKYLGYEFLGPKVTVRENTVQKLRDSIIKIFTAYKYAKKSDMDILIWRVNLRITGCQFNGTKYGWLFYFSQINDLTVLAKLDNFILKQTHRYHIQTQNSSIPFKKFSRTYYEINCNLKNTNYIPNFDEYTNDQKANVLQTIFKENISSLAEDEINYKFKKVIFRNIRKLQSDLSKMS